MNWLYKLSSLSQSTARQAPDQLGLPVLCQKTQPSDQTTAFVLSDIMFSKADVTDMIA